jgi:two-component system, LuxR family, sensor kinase FixL
VEFPPDLPTVPCDPTELSIVFRNLVINGVLHNSRETPSVQIGAATDDEQVTFIVADNGDGLASSGNPGTGAGLVIVRKFVESFKGRLWWESAPDTGTTFYFTVPLHE